MQSVQDHVPTVISKVLCSSYSVEEGLEFGQFFFTGIKSEYGNEYSGKSAHSIIIQIKGNALMITL